MDEWDAADIPETGARPFDPDERFNAVLSDAEKIKVLGAGKYALYRDGKIRLADLVTPTFSERWGRGLRATTLRELREAGVEAAPIIEQVAAGATRRATTGSWLDDVAAARAEFRGFAEELIENADDQLGIVQRALRIGQHIDDEAQRRIANLPDVDIDGERQRLTALADEASAEMAEANRQRLALNEARRARISEVDTQLKNGVITREEYWDTTRAEQAAYKKEYDRLSKLQDKAYDRAVQYRRELQRVGNLQRRAEAEVYRDVLREAGVEFGGTVESATVRSPAIQSLRRIEEWIPSRWINASNTDRLRLRLKWTSNYTGGHYEPWSGSISTGLDSTTLHEMMHRAESTVREIVQWERLFYRYRTTGRTMEGDMEPLQRLGTASGGGTFRPDEFPDNYMGRWYDDFAYELLSDGYANGIVYGEYDMDAEYRAFLWTMMVVLG